jgi:hypothetical protein
MTTEQLTGFLAERVMGWSVGPDRFVRGKRGWMPRWRFQPAQNLEDAFRLLDCAAPDEFSISGGNNLEVVVRVRIGEVIREASGTSKPLAITHAIARAVGIEVES